MNKSRNITRLITIAALGLCAFGVMMPSAWAATRTWDGGGGATHTASTCANWSSDLCPVNGDSVIFDSTSTSAATWDLASSVTIVNFQVLATTSPGYTGTITLSTNLTITSVLTLNAGTLNAGSTTLTLSGSGTPLVSGGGTFTASASTVVYSGTTATNVTGTITLDGVSSSSAGGGSATLTWSHTVGPDSYRMLIVGVSYWTVSATDPTTGVTYSGQSLTKIGNAIQGTAPISSLWYLLNPPTGTANIVVTRTNTGEDITAGATSWSGVNQSTPLGTAVTATGTSTTPSVTVSSASGEVVVDNAAMFSGNTLSPLDGQTQRYAILQGNAHAYGSSEPGAASTTMSWTQSASERWATIAVPMKPVITYNNLNLGGGATTATYTAAGDITVSGVLTVVSSSGTNTFDASSRTITLTNTGTPFVISATEVFTPSTSTVTYTHATSNTVTATTYNNLTFNGAGTSSLASSITANGTVTLSSTATLSLSTGVTIIAANMTVGTGTTVSSNGTGSAGGVSHTAGSGSAGGGIASGTNAMGGGGGGHGGTGGAGGGATGGAGGSPAYDSSTQPNTAGSGGSGGSVASGNSGGFGGAGGGAIKLVISGTLTITSSGIIKANGSVGAVNGTSNMGAGGGGSGGAIWVVAGTVTGTATTPFQAAGGAGGNSSPEGGSGNGGGGGGGGRIGVASCTQSLSNAGTAATLTAGGAAGTGAIAGAAGNAGSLTYTSKNCSTVSGTVYSDAGSVTINGSPTLRIRVSYESQLPYTVAVGSDGAYSISSVMADSAEIITAYLDTGGGANGAVVTRSAGSAITSLNIYQNTLIATHADAGPITIANVGTYDNDNDTDLGFTGNGSTLTVNSGWSLLVWSGKTLDISSGTLTLAGSGTPLTVSGTLTTTSSTVNYTGTSATTVAGGITYANLNLGTAATAAARSWTLGSGTTTVSGVLTLNTPSSGTNTFDISSRTLTLSGSGTPLVTNSQTITVTSSTVNYTGTTATNVVGGITYATLNLGTAATGAARTWTLGSGTTTVSGVLTLNTPSLGTNTFDISNRTLTLSGSSTPLVLNSQTFTVTGSTVNYTSATGATVTGTTYNSVLISSSVNNQTFTLNADTVIAALTIDGGQGCSFCLSKLDTSTFALTVNGGLTLGDGFAGQGQLLTNSSNVTVTGDINIIVGTLSGTPTLTVGTATTTGNIYGGGAISLTGGTTTLKGSGVIGGTQATTCSGTNGAYSFGSLTLGDGSNAKTTTACGNFTVTGNLLINGGGASHLLGLNGKTATVGGNWTNSGTFTHNNGTVTFNATSTGKTINPGSSNFNAVTFNGAGGGWTIQTNAATMAGDLTMTAGTLNASSNVTANGNVVGTAGLINISNAITFEQRVAAAKNFGPTTASTNWTFSTLTFSNSNAGATPVTVTAQSCATCGVTVSNVLNIGKSGDAAGATTTLSAGDKTWTLSGTTGTPLAILAAPAAVFTPSSSTFVYSGNNAGGNTTVTATTYNHLQLNNAAETYVVGNTTCNGDFTATAAGQPITFTAGTTLNVAGTLTLTGIDGSLVTLRSSSAGTQWNLSATGTNAMSYVDVKDSNACPNTVKATFTLDSGNNDCWNTFGGAGTSGSGTLESPAIY